MPARNVYEYAVVRVVPRVDREEFLNAGVVLFCKASRFLALRWQLDEARLSAFAPGIDGVPVARGGDFADPLDVGADKGTPLKHHLEAGIVGGIVAAGYLYAAFHILG